MRRAISVFLLCAGGLLCSCNQSTPAEDSDQPPKRFKLHGEIVSLEPEGHIAKIRHEKIDGWMEAMTMEFPVKDPAEYKTLHAGECITAIVFVQDLKFWVGEIQESPSDAAVCAAQ